MRIVQLIDTLHPGGAERMATNMANAFSENKIPNAILCTRQLGDLKQNLMQETHLFCAKKRYSLDVFAWYRGLKFIHSVNPDVIHAHSSSLFWAVLYVLLRSNCILIWHDHNGERSKLGRLKNLPFLLMSLRVDFVVSVNEELKHWAKENLFIDKTRVEYLRNFPYLQLSKGKREGKDVVILMIANLREPKDHHTLIDALAILKESGYNDFKLLLLGKTNEKSEYTQTLRMAIKKNNLESNVKLLGQSTVETALSMANIGVLASKSEGLPVSLLEYGLAGLPVVVTDVGQCAEVVGHGQYGQVVPPRAPSDLALALTRIIDDYESAQKMGEGFKQHILNEYGSQKFLKEYFRLIDA
ncbi:MAG: glycosyltransferase [bacterium]|nr:glycosyltransferase [bacterium]